MTATSKANGRDIHYVDDEWRYVDDNSMVNPDHVDDGSPVPIKLSRKPKVAQVVLLKVESMFVAPIMKSGLYNWHKALDGEFVFYKDVKGRLSEYDILLVVADRSTFSHRQLSKMREELGDSSDTKIVASIDYAIELWQDSLEVALVEHEMKQADYIFVSEPANQEYMSALLGRSDIPIMRHPIDVAQISQFRKPHYERDRDIFSIAHKWEQNWFAAHLAGRDHGVAMHKMIFMQQPKRVDMRSFFDECLPPHPAEKFPEWCDWMSKQWIYLEPYNMIHTFGRSVVECATLGLCCVGANICDGISNLYPDLATPAGAVNQQRKLIDRLLNDIKFYEECASKAIAGAEQYSYANRRREFMEMIGYVDSIQSNNVDEKLPRSAAKLG